MENFFIGYSVQNKIELTTKESQLRKPEHVQVIPDYLNFNIQFEGEQITFDLHYYQCKDLVEKLNIFLKVYEISYKNWENECKNKKND